MRSEGRGARGGITDDKERHPFSARCTRLMMKEFLVAYDYGQGAVWAYVSAESREQIETLFPELTIVDKKPSWLAESAEERIRSNPYFRLDVYDAGVGFLADILRSRTTGGSEE